MAKTKALISCAITAQLNCVFLFAYANSRFSHDEAQLSPLNLKVNQKNTNVADSKPIFD